MIVDLFAGPGGWSEGLRMLGLSDIGIEWDHDACRTRAAAGHLTVRADVAQYPPHAFAGATGLIASPPCQDFSTAGQGAGRSGVKGRLVDVVPEWVQALRPTWVACEQVPGVLPIWQEHAASYRALGYWTWVGVLDAADYGVPQNRKRAILIASVDGPVHPPTPTHGPAASLFGALAPVALADVVGLAPGWHYDSGQNSRGAGGTLVRYRRSCDRPAGTLTTKCVSQWVLNGPCGERRKLTRADALAIQTFPAGYPVAGGVSKQDQQIGNAVPPVLAAHVIAAVVGAPVFAGAPS